MSAPVSHRPFRPDCDVICLPDLSEWLAMIGASDAAVWASFVDYKSLGVRVSI
jgi:hypothetical protein